MNPRFRIADCLPSGQSRDDRPITADSRPDRNVACAYPQGATGEQATLDYLMALPGFDHAEMIKAMSSVGNAVFPVWRKSA
jgi:hypothetical protein